MSNRNYTFDVEVRQGDRRVFIDVTCSKIRLGNQYTGIYTLHLTLDDTKTLSNALDDALLVHKHASLIRVLEGEEDE